MPATQIINDILDKDFSDTEKQLSSSLITNENIIYHSVQGKTKELVEAYAKTDQLSHRYLAYRDLPLLIKEYVKGTDALDYGTGTGISANFLHKLGLNVIGTDINLCMLEKARESSSQIDFFELKKLIPQNQFDLIFSSFVLFDMKSKEEIIDYLNKAIPFMKQDGILIGITGSEELYSTSRNWTAFNSNFDQNRNLKSGDITKLRLKHPSIEFCDYFWKESDYIECFQNVKLNLLKIHKPIGSENDPYNWEDEKLVSPFTVYILKKQ